MKLNLPQLGAYPWIQWTLAVLFAVYIILPIPTPDALLPWVNSPLGIVIFVIITVVLFAIGMPLLALLYIFVAYEISRRSQTTYLPYQGLGDSWYTQSYAYGNKPTRVTETPDVDKDEQLRRMNPSPQTSLEEQIVNVEAPIGVGSAIEYTSSGYKPVVSPIYGGGSAL